MSTQTEISNYFNNRKKKAADIKKFGSKPSTPLSLAKSENLVLKDLQLKKIDQTEYVNDAIKLLKKRKRSPIARETKKKSRVTKAKVVNSNNTLHAFCKTKNEKQVKPVEENAERKTPQKVSLDDPAIKKFIAASPSRGAQLLQAAAARSPAKAQVTPVKKCLFGDDDVMTTISTKDDLKMKLLRSNKLNDVKAGLARMNEKRKELQEMRQNGAQPKPAAVPGVLIAPGSPKLKTFNYLEITSPKKMPGSPVKSPTKFIPVTPTKSGRGGLSLPFKYRYLEEVFRSFDQVLSLLYNRSERITFEKVKPAVQQMMRRNFNECNLAQILHVYPDAVKVTQEKVQVSLNSHKYMMVLTPQLLQTEDGTILKQMTASVLLKRRADFRSNLINITKLHHKEYLEGLPVPIYTKLENLSRWHPDFPLEDLPNVPGVELPKPPVEETYKTAVDVLEKARELNPRMKAAMDKVAAMKKLTEEKPAAEKPATEKISVPKQLRGISIDLLQRIRKKEAEKLKLEMTRNPESEARIDALQRLPELARIMRSVFIGEKKAALPIDVVIKKLAQSTKAMLTPIETRSHFDLLASEQPTWISIHTLSSGTYVKLNKNSDINAVVKQLDVSLEKERNNMNAAMS